MKKKSGKLCNRKRYIINWWILIAPLASSNSSSKAKLDDFLRKCNKKISGKNSSYPDMTLHLLICISKMAATQLSPYYLFNQYIKWKKSQENFATGNAIYLLPRTIAQIANDNSIFRKEGIFWLHARYEKKIFVWYINIYLLSK
jgi:hypothetical protein